jgi:hypothetical protein
MSNRLSQGHRHQDEKRQPRPLKMMQTTKGHISLPAQAHDGFDAVRLSMIHRWAPCETLRPRILLVVARSGYSKYENQGACPS